MERTNLIESKLKELHVREVWIWTKILRIQDLYWLFVCFINALFCPKQKSTEVIVVQGRILHMITPPMNKVTVTRISTNILCKR